MQIIYAAPFILLSLICFGIFVSVPALRRHALSALVAPVAFGFSSLVGWIAFAFAPESLHSKFRPAYSLAIEGVLFYVLPGVVGSWLAIRSVRFIEQTFFGTRTARNFLLRSVFSLIAGGFAFVLGLGITAKVLPLNATYRALVASFAIAISVMVLTFVAILAVQNRADQMSTQLQGPFQN